MLVVFCQCKVFVFSLEAKGVEGAVGLKSMHVDVFNDCSPPEVASHVLAETLVGSLLNSWRNEKANPEYVVPKSMAATIR